MEKLTNSNIGVESVSNFTDRQNILNVMDMFCFIYKLDRRVGKVQIYPYSKSAILRHVSTIKSVPTTSPVPQQTTQQSTGYQDDISEGMDSVFSNILIQDNTICKYVILFKIEDTNIQSVNSNVTDMLRASCISQVECVRTTRSYAASIHPIMMIEVIMRSVNIGSYRPTNYVILANIVKNSTNVNCLDVITDEVVKRLLEKQEEEKRNKDSMDTHQSKALSTEVLSNGTSNNNSQKSGSISGSLKNFLSGAKRYILALDDDNNNHAKSSQSTSNGYDTEDDEDEYGSPSNPKKRKITAVEEYDKDNQMKDK